MTPETTLESVKDYYGRVLRTSRDLKTSACCTAEAVPQELGALIARLHPEVRERFYGCGSPFPPLLGGLTVLDLGCGSGRDAFVLSNLVGSEGRVIGIDMTRAQLDVARSHVDYHRREFGFDTTNITLIEGYIEDLETAGIVTASVDLVVSNCVINLSPDKHRVFSELIRVLKPGGELYFSDVYCDRRLPPEAAHDPVLLGECLGGALYVEDFRRLLSGLGVADFRSISRAPLELHDPDVLEKAGAARFSSDTIRLFKIDGLEDRCEDYGQLAVYRGTIPGHPRDFTLDDHHVFAAGTPVRICSNTALMLSASRYGKHFRIQGDTTTHYGLFDCGPGSRESSSACC